MTDRDFEPVRRIARESLAWRTGERLIAAAIAAWQESTALARLRAVTNHAAGLPAHDRLRWVAVAVAWAALLHGAGRIWLPAYAVSGLPVWWHGLIVAAAVAVALAPHRFVAAWGESAARRLWRQM